MISSAFERIVMPPGGEAVGRAPGKLILMGEHFVVHGAPAVAVPVEALRLEVRARLGVPEGAFPREDPGPHARLCLELACRRFGVDPGRISVEIQSDLPVGAGMGSSAALSVAMALAVGRLAGRESRTGFLDAVREVSLEAERAAHGRPSGIDTEVCLLRRGILFEKGAPVRYLDPGGQMALVVVLAGPGARTADMVALAEAFRRNNPLRYEELLHESIRAAHEAARALEAGDAEGLGRLMNQQHSRLQELGVSTAELDRVVSEAVRAGACGAKLSGAGGGGVAIAVCRPETARQVADGLAQGGFQVLAVESV